MQKTSRLVRSFLSGAALLTFVASTLVTRPAHADVTLVDKDGWRVFINGRVQTFLNYNNGDGYPPLPEDGYGQSVTLLHGGSAGNFEDFAEGETPGEDQAKVEEMRIRTGFVGNVLGFGIRNQLNEQTDVTAYTAVTVYIDSTSRRKYLPVTPDWRESYLRITAPWGSVTAGRTLVLFNRGATEITYLYGFKYGLGWVGDVSTRSQSGPGAGHVGFGVLGNGFGAGIAYATPSLGGLQLTAGIYDANNLPGSAGLERTKWPRPEAELTYEMDIGTLGMFKLFGNGAYQKVYEDLGQLPGREGEQALYGVGYGGRVELGPFHLGLAGHYGRGVGVDFALQPSDSLWNQATPEREPRKVDGYYAQAMVSVMEKLDLHAGAGITRVHLLEEDKQDQRDSDGDELANDPDGNGQTDSDGDGVDDAPFTPTPRVNDDADPALADPVGNVPIKHNLGFSAGLTFHVAPSLHLNLEYFRAIFQWHTPLPEPVDGSEGPTQKFHVVNAGITYDF